MALPPYFTSGGVGGWAGPPPAPPPRSAPSAISSPIL